MQQVVGINFISYDFRPISHGFPEKQFVNENFHFSKFSIFIRVLSVTPGDPTIIYHIGLNILQVSLHHNQFLIFPKTR